MTVMSCLLLQVGTAPHFASTISSLCDHGSTIVNLIHSTRDNRCCHLNVRLFKEITTTTVATGATIMVYFFKDLFSSRNANFVCEFHINSTCSGHELIIIPLPIQGHIIT